MILSLYSAAAGQVLAAVPDPGQGVAPPGAQGILTLLQWGAWLAFAACVGGVLKAGGGMAWARSHGGGGNEHTSTLMWAVAGAIVTGSAASIITLVG